jgi:cell division protein FtsZ
MIEFMDFEENAAKIRVVGVGGGGNNALNTMIREELEGVDFIAANTDAQALSGSLAPIKIQMGENLTRGLGAGANPEIGRNAALESKERFAEVLDGADMVFITAGMGGGTGTGGAPIIAEVARSLGCLTVGVVTRPFNFEGKRRARQAEQGIVELKTSVDTLITIPNEKLIAMAGESTSMLDAFTLVDLVLHNAVQGISDLVVVRGLINVDFADVRTVMQSQGLALMGTGRSSGPKRALEAACTAVQSPLLEEVAITGATGILLNVTSGPDLKLHEVNEAACYIQEQAHEDANIIFGAVVDERMGEDLKVTVIATGFESHPARRGPGHSHPHPQVPPQRDAPGRPAVRARPGPPSRGSQARPRAAPHGGKVRGQLRADRGRGTRRSHLPASPGPLAAGHGPKGSTSAALPRVALGPDCLRRTAAGRHPAAFPADGPGREPGGPLLPGNKDWPID